MYLLILLSGSIGSTLIYFVSRGKKEIQTLALILWGATIMFIVDKAYAYFIDGESFIELSFDSILLGFTLLTTGFTLWLIYIAIHRLLKKTSK
ncbi:MAG: hypothetical protein QXO78_00890 [Desulfurococcaceae archaeon]